MIYKINFREVHVRAVPRVDLRGDAARAVIAAAAPIVAWLDAREPGVVVRSISVNDKRVLVSVESTPRPRALRFDPPFSDDLRAAGAAAEALIQAACDAAIKRRLL